MLVKLDGIEEYVFHSNAPKKIPFDTHDPYELPEVDCGPWSTRSGLHYTYCHTASGELITGYVVKLWEVARFAPMTYHDALNVPTKEPKNVVENHREVWRRFIESTLQLLPDTTNVAVLESQDGVEIFIYKPYTTVAKVKELVHKQSNLLIMKATIHRKYYDKLFGNGKTALAFRVSSHVVVLPRETPVVMGVIERKTYTLTAAATPLISGDIVVAHPEHGVDQIRVEPEEEDEKYRTLLVYYHFSTHHQD